MKKTLFTAVLCCTALVVSAIEDQIIFAESFRKDKGLYKVQPEVINGRRLALTEDGVLCGKNNSAPILKLDPKKWNGADGAISFCITPVDWESGKHDKEIIFFYTLLKNHGNAAKGFVTGDTTMLLKMRRTNPKAKEQLILQGQDGKSTKHRAYCVMTDDRLFSFKPGKTTWIAAIWKKGGKVSLYIDGKLAGSGMPYHFPPTEKLNYLSFMNGNSPGGFGVVDGTSYFTDLAILKGTVTIEDLALLRSTLTRKKVQKSAAAPAKVNTENLPIVPFPAPAKKPVLDGKFDEYNFQQNGFLHETTGILTAMPGTFYSAADQENIYIGAQIDIRDKNYVPVSSAVNRDDPAMIASGDLAAAFLRSDTDAAAQGFKGAYITVAPNNNLYDALEDIDWSKNSCARNSRFNTGTKSFSRFKNGIWQVEMVIPRNKIGLKNDFLFTFGLRVANKTYLLRPYNIWFDHPDGFIRGKVCSGKIAVSLANPAAGNFDLKINSDCKMDAALFSARIVVSSEGVVMDKLLGEKTNFLPEQQLMKKSGRNIAHQTGIKNKGLYLISVEGKNNSGTIFRRTIPFSVRGMVDLAIKHNPVKKVLKVDADFVGEKLRKGDLIQLQLVKGGKVVATTGKKVEEEVLDAALPISYSTEKLAVGKYEVKILRNGKFAAAGKFSKNPLPEWLTNPLGLEALKPDWVPAPWTPVEINGKDIRVWGRTFRFGKGGLTTVISQNRNILYAPLALRYSIGSKQYTLPLDTKSVKRLGKGRVQAEVAGKDANIAASFLHTIEFDGLDWVNCSVKPLKKNLKINDMYLALELDNVPYYMSIYDYCSQMFGYTKDKDFMRMTAIWHGGERAGINTLFENHKGLLINSSKPRFSVRKKAGDKAEYRIYLCNAPAQMKNLEWRFALHPTPFKPLYDKWEDERPFMMEWFGYPFNFICLHTHSHAASSTDFRPRNWKLGKTLGALAKAHNQKLYPYTIATFISRERAIKPDAPFTRYRLPDSYFYKVPERPQTEEYPEFGDDWNFNPVSTYPGDGSRHTEMIACSPASSFSDYSVYMQAKYMKECGLAGFYYDLTTTRENLDENRGYKYTTADGKVEGTRELYATRNLLKRLYCEFGKIGGKNVPYIFAHGFAILSSASSFWGVSFHGEEYKPKKINGLAEMLMVDYQNGDPVMHGPHRDSKTDYSGVLWRLAYGPYIWGLPQIHLSQYALNRPIAGKPQTGRELLALCFVNNTLYDPSYANWQIGAQFHHEVTIPYQMSSATFHGYWENGIKTTHPAVKVSYWKKKDGSQDYLVAVANWSPKPVVAEVELPDFLANAYFVGNMESINRITRWENVGKKWKVAIPACDLKVFRFIGSK